jgi:general secretion pathway protein A
VWRGDFATFWRVPEGWREGAEAGGDTAARAWLAQRLDAAGLPGPRPLRERVGSFQIAQGLVPDGRAGPMTVMLLSRAAGIEEPVLQGVR